MVTSCLIIDAMLTKSGIIEESKNRKNGTFPAQVLRRIQGPRLANKNVSPGAISFSNKNLVILTRDGTIEDSKNCNDKNAFLADYCSEKRPQL